MVNERELKVLKSYEQKGYHTIRCGSPDFLFVKTKDGNIVESLFVEVKSPVDNLSYEQFIWKKVIEGLGANYKVIEVK